MLSISFKSMLNKTPRLLYHTQALAYVRIEAVGVTNWCIKKWWNTPIIRKSVEMPRIKPLSTILGTDKLMYHGLQR